MRKIKCLFACLTLSLAALESQAQEVRWVADELETYVRSGPTNEYRIVGTLTSGDEVTVLETQGDYSRVRAPSGDEVWIESDQLQAERSVSKRVPELQEKAETLSTRLEGIDEEWQDRVATMTETLQQREARIAELERRNAELNQQASQAIEQIRGLQARLDTQEQDLLMRYFMYGGGVAGAGLVVGLLVPHLPRRRKKRDRWF
ncbi:SH3 domain protein [Modicisalibacter xianhensis]|uniref:SH3 domain protein n=1 Tax=Modicisalibacter xianhensis TaxID=442341 RepID=A0A4R8G9Z6_9GAMM|nr:TIGR04211 family SH3 domain-containing protein [Halomonas xianhensis]TDX32362.1 SH3 domain protein [Halomonas xianhensis]